MSFTSLLNGTCTIQRGTVKQTQTGNARRVWADVSTMTDIPCRLEPLSGNEFLMQGREGTRTSHRAFIDPGYTLSTADRLVKGGKTYDITFVPEYDDSTVAHHIELLLLLRE